MLAKSLPFEKQNSSLEQKLTQICNVLHTGCNNNFRNIGEGELLLNSLSFAALFKDTCGNQFCPYQNPPVIHAFFVHRFKKKLSGYG